MEVRGQILRCRHRPVSLPSTSGRALIMSDTACRAIVDAAARTSGFIPSGTRLPATSDPSGNPREQESAAKGPDDMVAGARADSRCGHHQKKCTYNDHCLSRERPDPASDTTNRGGLPSLAEPSGEPPQNVSVAKALHGVFARHSATFCRREQKSKYEEDDCGLSPKRPGELRPKTDYDISSDKQPERDRRP